MIFITGGAYQGKLEYAKNNLGIKDEDIYICNSSKGVIDANCRCIYGIEKFTLYCANNGIDAVDELKSQLKAIDLSDKVFICEDISCGVVPLDANMRAWREANGKVSAYIATQADNVYRLFCGLSERLK